MESGKVAGEEGMEGFSMVKKKGRVASEVYHGKVEGWNVSGRMKRGRVESGRAETGRAETGDGDW